MLADSITYWSLTLKNYCANWALSMSAKEQYGEDECESCWDNLILATELVSILDCYDVDGDNCLTANQISEVFQISSHIVNKRCA